MNSYSFTLGLRFGIAPKTLLNSHFSLIIRPMSQNKRCGLLALVALIALTLLFFWKILLTNLILSGVDVFLYFYPYKAYVAEALRQGRLPLWNPHLFMGAPLMANSQVGLFYPPNWFFLWLDAPKQVAWSIGLHIALAGGLMLAFTRHTLLLDWRASLIAAILFAFGGYLGAQVEHINQLQAAAWLPLLFLLYDSGLRRQTRRPWVLLLALIIALTLLAGHAQTVFISLFGLGLYALWQAILESAYQPFQNVTDHHQLQKKSSIKINKFIFYPIAFIQSIFHYLWPIGMAAILAAALAAIQLLPTAELSGLSIRSEGLTFQEVVSFSLRPTNLHYSLLPPINVDLTQVMGEAFGEWVAYLGITGLVLAMLGILSAIWQPAARRFIFLSGGGLVLSFGLFTGPLYIALYHLVPGFDLFRVPARWLLLYAFGMAVLAGFGFNALLTPNTLSKRLVTIRRWFRTGRRWRLALLVMPIIFLLTLIVWKTPPFSTLFIWLVLATVSLGLIYYILFFMHHSRVTIARAALVILLVTELFWTAQVLNYNQPTAPQAYHSMRNAIAYLLAADPPNRNTPPDRFLSLSGVAYDPGDMADLQNIFGDRLSEKALYNLVVATKEKEVLFFNLPLIYGLHSVDGYDGGILPLSQFVTLQQLFLPANNLSQDGRLREKLRFVPPGRLLSLLNTRWIITDKVFDVWIDGIFYDLQFPAQLVPGQTITTRDIPDFSATAIGLVSHLEGAINVSDGTPVAEVVLTFADGGRDKFTLQAGIDTAEGVYSNKGEAAHAQATIGVTWPYEAGGVDYITLHTLPTTEPVTEITVTATAGLPTGQFVLRGLSLIHQPTNTSRSVILSTAGDYRQVHSGDVKVYENLAVLPRAFIVHQAELVQTESEAIALLQDPKFDPLETLVYVTQNEQAFENTVNRQASPQDIATIVSYTPERVEVETKLASPGWLVLMDTFYPGWQATVDGQPVDILPVNILFRAIEISEGEHTVIFEFKPDSLQWGALISVGTLLIVVIGLSIMQQSHNQKY